MNKHGLYSKAAEIIRSLPQEKGTVDQYIAAAKARGAKPAELEHAGRPEGDKITREEMAKHFENSLPDVRVDQYGENPSYMPRGSSKRFMDLQMRSFKSDNPLSPDERRELDRMMMLNRAAPNVMIDEENEQPTDTNYGDYTIPGGQNYRERLLSLQLPADPRHAMEEKLQKLIRTQNAWPEGHPARDRFDDQIADLKSKIDNTQPTGAARPYQSSHWSGHPNVLAHIRMSDRVVGEDRDAVRPIAEKLSQALGVGIRDLASGATSVGLQRGVITPEEAASLSRVMGWRNGYDQGRGIGKRLLHVEELQSDWGQEGRDKGFNTGAARRAYDDHVEDMRARMRQNLLDQGLPERVAKPLYENAKPWELSKYHGGADTEKLSELDKAAIAEDKGLPTAPYVQNTQHWTDLALKNVLREAALGNYEGVVFSPGQAQADRYGLEKTVDSIKYFPEDRTLSALQGNSTRIARPDVGPEDLPSLIGKELTEKLLHPDSIRRSEFDGSQYHMLQGDEMKVGAGGMKGYYDNIVPKSIMRLAQQHDPSVKPGEPVQIGDYQGFHLPMTETLKNSILDKGFPAMKRGGTVDVDKALAATRSFTKDGGAAIMRLKD